MFEEIHFLGKHQVILHEHVKQNDEYEFMNFLFVLFLYQNSLHGYYQQAVLF